MANNYCQFSGILEIPKETKEQAVAIIRKAGMDHLISEKLAEEDEESLEYDDERGVSFEGAEVFVDGERNEVWFHSEEAGSIDAVEAVARALIDYFRIDDPFVLSWAFTCSKPRVDEFGGGAFCIVRGKETHWIDAMEDATQWGERNKPVAEKKGKSK